MHGGGLIYHWMAKRTARSGKFRVQYLSLCVLIFDMQMRQLCMSPFSTFFGFVRESPACFTLRTAISLLRVLPALRCRLRHLSF